jgi:hypothetical protein
LGDARFEGLYLVVFRSVRRAAADLALLKEHDDQAYAAALEAGGLLRYFKGEVNGRRECLSFCLWESREQAVVASGCATHRRAAQLSAEMYESYELERYDLVKTGGSLVFRPLEGDGAPRCIFDEQEPCDESRCATSRTRDNSTERRQ